jgi:hypothetical protein
MVSKGKAARDKGHSFERRIARDFRPIFPECIRQLEYQAGLGIDLANTDEYDFQLKCKKKHASINTINEIPIKPDRVRVLISKEDRQPIMAVIAYDDLFKMMAELKFLRQKELPMTLKDVDKLITQAARLKG